MPQTATSAPSAGWVTFAPVLFVLIWSTGWIAAGYAAQDADALTFLTIRHALAAAALALIVVWRGDAWPRGTRLIIHTLLAGALLSGFYLAGVWWAVRHGVPAGLSGVIAALQPLLTALLAPVLISETVTARQWAGISLGFLGLMVTFAPKLTGLETGNIAGIAWPLAINAFGMLAATLGGFYQKRFVTGVSLLPATALQFAGALLVTAPLAWLLEPMQINWTPAVILTMAWSVLVLSIGGVSLFINLIRRGAIARATAFIYLVPAVSAAMAYIAFGETLSALQIAGLLVTVAGVWLSSR